MMQKLTNHRQTLHAELEYVYHIPPTSMQIEKSHDQSTELVETVFLRR